MAGLSNKEIARVFRAIETLLKVLGEDDRRAMTYGRVSRILETLPESAADLAAAGELSKVRGIGPSIQGAVAELVDRGSCGLIDDLAARVSPGVLEILRIPGLGPKKVHALVTGLGVDSLEELREAAESGSLAKVKGFGAKTALKVMEGIDFLGRTRGLVRVDDGYALAERSIGEFGLAEARIAGGLRRGEVLVDTVSLVAVGRPGDFALSGAALEGDAWVVPRGAEPGLRVRLVEQPDWARALFEETGPKDHVESVLARPGAFGSEEEIYASRGLHYVPPERRHAGDGTAAVEPLVSVEEMRGLVHAHTTWSDGTLDIEGMAAAAEDRGYDYFTVTDHSRSAAYAGGLSVDRLQAQAEAVRNFNAAGGKVQVLHGIEADILPDGSLDYPDEVLASLDFVIASVHSSFGQDRESMTERIVRAVRNPHVDILGHMTGRLLLRREPYAVDVEAVLQAAAEAGTAVELNANPWRLDLDPGHHAHAKELGIRVPIGPDAHSAEGMDDVRWGVLVARHGGLGPEDVPNTGGCDAFLEAIGR
jgi:DNA polymerase (family 10)